MFKSVLKKNREGGKGSKKESGMRDIKGVASSPAEGASQLPGGGTQPLYLSPVCVARSGPRSDWLRVESRTRCWSGGVYVR